MANIMNVTIVNGVYVITNSSGHTIGQASTPEDLISQLKALIALGFKLTARAKEIVNDIIELWLKDIETKFD